MRVFVAGASGVIGRRLVPQLVERGHQVVATTRSTEKGDRLRALGARPAVMDGLDATSVGEAIARAEPEVVVHQMTALTGVGDLRRFDEEFALTNELRTRGSDNLLAASEAVGVRRFVAQSYTGWPNERVGGPVKSEDDPLDSSPPARQQKTLEAIRHLEEAVSTADLEGLVLRYGNLYGPSTSLANEYAQAIRKRKLPVVGDGGGIWSFLHVDDAAAATVLAVEQGPPGLYDVVDDDPAPVAEWLPHLAHCLGAPPPRRVPAWLARLAIGEVGVSMMTQIRGSSNAKAKQELGWQPAWPSWREGFRLGLVDEPVRSAA
ncbi:MAG TPA: NAD(P)-dependent oxidoreductase [Gaiellaceae bacterium]|nr:NAD(P)-dependent oxidoreductase [Gaiellaceae bacterium]